MRTKADSADLLPYMEHIGTDVMDKILDADASFDPNAYSERDVRRALDADRLDPDGFGALLSPAAEGMLENIARRAKAVTRDHFGNAVTMFTPIYTSNYCENRCRYCGFNRENDITRARLDPEEVETDG